MNSLEKLRILAAIVVVLGIQSCSNSPSGPDDLGMADPNFLEVASPTDTSGTPVSITKTVEIDGKYGGKVTLGRFTVSIPPGAYANKADVTITVHDVNLLECDLSITPEAANDFAYAVTLTTDCQGTNFTNAVNLLQVWYDPAASLWYPVPGYRVDTLNTTVSVPLFHFSRYGVCKGKNGW